MQAYLARTGTAAPADDVLAQVSRLQRVYQLTTDDASMTVLLRGNLDSAYAITRYDAAGFTRAFAAKLGGGTTPRPPSTTAPGRSSPRRCASPSAT